MGSMRLLPLLAATSMLTGTTGQAIAPSETPPHERPGAAPAARAARDDPAARSAPAVLPDAPYPSVQVNVDETGLNIVGDAANEPSIAIDPVRPDNHVAGWRQFDSITSSFREAGYARSSDGGAQWTFPGSLQDGVFRSDPVLDASPNGAIHYLSLTDSFECALFTSLDDGLTWLDPVPAFGGDKPWMTVDRSDGPGRGNLYAFFRDGVSTDIVLTRSFDGGASFDGLYLLPDQPGRGTLSAGPDGVVHLVGVSFLSDDIVATRTTNAYIPTEAPVFEPVVTVDLGGVFRHRSGPNPGGLLGQVWVAVDQSEGPTRGNVYVLCSVDPPGPDPLDVMLARSTDGGRTRSPPVRVNDDPSSPEAWQWFGTLSVAPTGRLDVTWNDTRETGSDHHSQLYYSWSEDAGATWSTNVALTPTFDSWLGWPQQQKIGDYNDQISGEATARLIYAATFNGEQDVYFVRIGDCNENGVHDGTDIATGSSADLNANGIPDDCECLGDADGNRVVDTADIIAVLAAWGPCPACPEDLDGDGTVDFRDLLFVLASWGECG